MSAALETPPDDAAAWAAEAARWWQERHPLPRLGTPEGDAPAWSFANVCAGYDEASMARVLVEMGLRRVATLARGDIRWWPPEYHRASRHWEREEAARLNRFLRGSRVFLMQERGGAGRVIPPPDLMLAVDVDAGAGAWRTLSGGAVGEDWISLGAFCWRVGRGAAAARIVRICGYRRLPRVGDLR
jgi:hypothetical protein